MNRIDLQDRVAVATGGASDEGSFSTGAVFDLSGGRAVY